MENAIFNGNLIVALEISKDFDTENMIREEGKYRHLRCPDPNCKSPFLRYCHGEKKQPYFAHLSNVSCDYSDYDMTPASQYSFSFLRTVDSSNIMGLSKSDRYFSSISRRISATVRLIDGS